VRHKNSVLILVVSAICFLYGCTSMSDARLRKSDSAPATASEASETDSASQQELYKMHYRIVVLQNEIINLRKEVKELDNRVSDLENEHEPHPKFLPDR